MKTKTSVVGEGGRTRSWNALTPGACIPEPSTGLLASLAFLGFSKRKR